MKAKAKLIASYQLPGTHRGVVQFEVDNIRDFTDCELNDTDVWLAISKYRKKRTMNMNAYFWVLVGELAKVLRTTPEELHTEIVNNHRILWLDDDGEPLQIVLKSEVDPSVTKMYWALYRTSSDGKWKSWLRIKGTSDMDTQEMSIVLDDLIEECKAQGIETATPDELERIKALG